LQTGNVLLRLAQLSTCTSEDCWLPTGYALYLICGMTTTRETHYLVGGSMDIQPLPNSTSDHYIGVGMIDQPHRPKLVLVPIRLFQQMGSPHHHVIVGRVSTSEQEARVHQGLAQDSAIRYPGV
jgi:hypothetical protein